MPTGSTLPVRLCLRSLMNVSVIAVTFADRAVQPERGVDAVREQIAGDAAAGDADVEAPQALAALRQVLRDRPVLQELRAVVKDASEPALVDQLLDQRHRRHAAVVVPRPCSARPPPSTAVDHLLRLRRRFGRAASRRVTILPAARRRDGDLGVRVVRAGDVDEIDVLALDERRASRSRPIRSPSSPRTP